MKIYCAKLEITNTENEYQWSEAVEQEYGEEWNGNALGYLLSLDDDDGLIREGIANWKNSDKHYAIHYLPENPIILADKDGSPYEMWWAAE